MQNNKQTKRGRPSDATYTRTEATMELPKELHASFHNVLVKDVENDNRNPKPSAKALPLKEKEKGKAKKKKKRKRNKSSPIPHLR
jgi:hypothetical protein